MKILDLPLKAKWYDMIESGVKTEEYRREAYHCCRLEVMNTIDKLKAMNGGDDESV